MADPTENRRETVFVAAMTFAGAILRFWGPGRLGLNHFDEGIYAIAGTWSLSPKGLASISPELVSYAPPLYPILVGIVYLFLGVSDISAIFVSQIAGVLTIPAVAWVARRTFGPGAGIAAATFCALSGPHIAFSRMALTDATFLLCWVLALGLGGWFLEKPGAWRAILFGLMVGLAQNAKYNGYLAGGIIALSALWGSVISREDRAVRAIRVLGYGILAAFVSGLIYGPWYRFVQSQPDGYAGLLRHHRSYLTGTTPEAWVSHWRIQMVESYALAGELTQGLTWGAIAWAIAWTGGSLCAGWTKRQLTSAKGARDYRPGMRLRLGFVLGVAVCGVAPNIGYWIALAMLPWQLMSRSTAARSLAVGFSMMALLTPAYHPYARLWLPLQAFGWLALAALVPDRSWGKGETGQRDTTTNYVERIQAGALALAILAAIASDAIVEPRARTLGLPIAPTDGLRIACDEAAAHLQLNLAYKVDRLQVVARPAVMFYLSQRLKVPLVRQPDIIPVAESWRPGDYVLMDSTLERVSSPNGYPFPRDRFHLPAMGASTQNFAMALPATTQLDVDAGVVFEPLVERRPRAYLEVYPIVPR